ncbi:hypothetical protein ASPACDRAFT_76707 [Aspergillus aculeatus ATCC 16872]|uniref:Beta-lactamase-related domain-containing protein n=1 Tax=Aspergillus aculeatus (strain ATCC 16872 / CBS 172.66 / WB 5094) TaxID=690307 RepID=A0A1L9X1R4_ASPA1|nr:uncharacterized protein ASPACDRAFT_76707 [Aspergillus aculeatus ATCC 16872]OJK02306.1 hypothetical protein ASPACDRAFT_76707 [Aspergillus aculeatus ATCC 16872]
MNGHKRSQGLLDDLETALSRSVEDGTWPGVVVAATNQSGSFRYAKAFGREVCTSAAKPLTTKSIMAFASMSKLITTVAALQLVEKKLVELNTDVSPLIPGLARQEILYGWDATTGRPLLHPRHTAITLRSLLTHSSGTAYDMSNSELARFAAYHGRVPNSGATVDERFGYPLLFEPDTAWEYGTGIDWVGQVVERITGQSLELYIKRHIWQPLGIERMSFWPTSITGKTRQARMSVRDVVSGAFTELEEPFLTEGVSECFGGQGIYGCLEEFLQVLHSILADDGKLLTGESIAEIFRPQLAPLSRDSLQRRVRESEPESSFIGIFDNRRLYDWGLGGMLALENEPLGRRKNTLFWSGKPNLFWFIDKESDLCGVLGAQFLPPGDQKVARMIEMFEAHLHRARCNSQAT